MHGVNINMKIIVTFKTGKELNFIKVIDVDINDMFLTMQFGNGEYRDILIEEIKEVRVVM